MDRSTRFGSTSSNLTPYSDSLSLWLHLLLGLTLLLKITRRLIRQKARGQAFPWSCLLGHSPSTGYKQTVSGSISLPSLGFFSPFLRSTCSLSVGSLYLALESGLPGFPQPYTWAEVLGNAITGGFVLSFTGLSPSMVCLSRQFS